jgi:hypothetical protein
MFEIDEGGAGRKPFFAARNPSQQNQPVITSKMGHLIKSLSLL